VRHLIRGFDYRTRQEVARPVAEWQEEIRRAVKDGGRRRVEDGETFIHGPDALIRAEIYANVPAPTGERS
jgi:hypothetical protein